MTKAIRARKNYTCYECKETINKGDNYRKKSRTIGNPQKWSTDGQGAFIQHGIRYDVKLCEECA